MKLKSAAYAVALVLFMALLAARAQAIAITDVDFRILPGDYVNPVAAILMPGNHNTASINQIFGGDPWALLDKTDSGSSTFNGVTFTVTAPENAQNGAWGLSWSGTGLPVVMDLVFVTKAATSWGAYLFDSVLFPADTLSGDGHFAISWTNNGGNVPGLSHAAVYARIVDQQDVPPITPVPPPPTFEVPVPSSLALAALGMMLLGWTRSRRQRNPAH